MGHEVTPSMTGRNPCEYGYGKRKQTGEHKQINVQIASRKQVSRMTVIAKKVQSHIHQHYGEQELNATEQQSRVFHRHDVFGSIRESVNDRAIKTSKHFFKTSLVNVSSVGVY